LWQLRLRPGVAHRTEVVCFPHAGGAASLYRPLAGLLDAELPVTAIQYPGRHDHRREPLITTIAGLADGVYRALDPARRGPMAFLGHSMGAVVAFEVAQRMEHELGEGPVVLFASGRRAPSRPRPSTVHLLDDDGLVAEIAAAGGTDPRLLDEPELLEMILPVVRADCRAIETYEYVPGPPLRCPIIALSGDDDRSVRVDEAQAWADHTAGRFELRLFPGGHFFLNAHLAEIVAVVGEHVLTATESRSSIE
jgi:surfactin synthase thioesterase subunit